MKSRTMCLDQVQCYPLPKDIKVQRLFWDWNDPSKTVEREIQGIGEGLKAGCWYLNPMFRVCSPAPTRDFFVLVRKRQREWFRVLSRQFGSSDWRPPMDVTRDLFQRRTGFTGILMVNGRVIDPRAQWQLEAQVDLHPESDLVLSRRPTAFAQMREQDWESLKALSRSELEQQLSSHSMDPVYVTPGITVMGFRADSAFYAEAMKRSNEWHGRLAHMFGHREMRALWRQSDWATRMLVFHGTLVVDGAIYVPGRWPNQNPTKAKLRHGPSGLPTIPPHYLGLNIPLELGAHT